MLTAEEIKTYISNGLACEFFFYGLSTVRKPR